MEQQQMRNRSRIHKLDLGIPGVRITVVQGDRRQVQILLDQGCSLFDPQVRDRSTYKLGLIDELSEANPGNDLTQALGKIFSCATGVEELEFKGFFGIRFRIAEYVSEPNATIITLANAMLVQSARRALITNP